MAWGRSGPDALRDFEELRAYDVVPAFIPYKRVRTDAKPAVLWHPDLERFLRDVARFRPHAHLRGLRHAVRKGTGSASRYAVLRIFLWAQGWDYPERLIHESFVYAVRQLAAFPLSRRRGKRVQSQREKVADLARRATTAILRRRIVYPGRLQEIRRHLPELMMWLLNQADAPEGMKRVSRCLSCKNEVPFNLLRKTSGLCPHCGTLLDLCSDCKARGRDVWLIPEPPWDGRCPVCQTNYVRRRLDPPKLEVMLSPLHGTIRSVAMKIGVRWDIETSSEWVTIRAMERAIRRVTTKELQYIRWGLRQMLVVLFEQKIIPNPQFSPFLRLATLDPEHVVRKGLEQNVSYLAAYVNVRRLSRYLPLVIAWGLAVKRMNRSSVNIYENPGDVMVST